MVIDQYEKYGKKALDVAYRSALAQKHYTLLSNILSKAQQGISPIDLPNLTEDELHCLHVHYIYPENNQIHLGQKAIKDAKVQRAGRKPKKHPELDSDLPWDQ